jgi:Mg2+-importing ATPase
MRYVRDFMVVFGLLSSGFDLLTFAVLLQVFHAGAPLFRTAWFVGSALTELAVLFVLRTQRRAYRSRPSRWLLGTSLLVAGLTVVLPFVSPLSDWLGLVPLPAEVMATLLLITTLYVVAAEVTKGRFFRAIHESPGPQAPTELPEALRQSRRLERLAHEHGRPRPSAPQPR